MPGINRVVLEGPVLDATNPPSPKTIAAGLVALIVPGLIAALMFLNTDQGSAIFAALPLLAVIGIKSVITGLVVRLVAFQVTDPQRILDLATSPKVIAATAASVLITAAIDVINYLITPAGAGLYSTWNPILVVAINAVLPGAAAYLAAFLTSDPARATSKNPDPVATIPARPDDIPGDVADDQPLDENNHQDDIETA